LDLLQLGCGNVLRHDRRGPQRRNKHKGKNSDRTFHGFPFPLSSVSRGGGRGRWRRFSHRSSRSTAKTSTVATLTSIQRPAPAASPSMAAIQIMAAVVSPVILPLG